MTKPVWTGRRISQTSLKQENVSSEGRMESVLLRSFRAISVEGDLPDFQVSWLLHPIDETFTHNHSSASVGRVGPDTDQNLNPPGDFGLFHVDLCTIIYSPDISPS